MNNQEEKKKNPRSLTFFDFNLTITESSQEEWLQITRVKDIGLDGKDIKQQIIRLSPEHQRELYELLHHKFRYEDHKDVKEEETGIGEGVGIPSPNGIILPEEDDIDPDKNPDKDIPYSRIRKRY